VAVHLAAFAQKQGHWEAPFPPYSPQEASAAFGEGGPAHEDQAGPAQEEQVGPAQEDQAVPAQEDQADPAREDQAGPA
jgi:hypothetical protein